MRIRAFLKVARLNDHSNLVKNVYCLFGNGLYRRQLFSEPDVGSGFIGRRIGATNIVRSQALNAPGRIRKLALDLRSRQNEYALQRS